jgi:hypothetical protein
LILPNLLFVLFVWLDGLIHFVCLIACYRSPSLFAWHIMVRVVDCKLSFTSFTWLHCSLDCHSERFSLFLTDTKPFHRNIVWIWIRWWANSGTRFRDE